MPNLNQAREWAEEGKDIYRPGSRIKAVIDIILSLPDQWVDAEKLREVVSKYEGNRYISEIVQDFVDLLPVPKLPTLADMTEEEQKACQWMQARLEGSAFDFVISDPGLVESMIWAKGGTAHIADNSLITPVPGPKLEWPGGVVDCEIVDESLDDQAVAKDVCNSEPNSSETPKSSIKPEDVPADELWLVEHGGLEFLAKRNREDAPNYPWFITSVDGMGSGIAADSEITLIHKLVPETTALPEGMRIADERTLGRVIVTTEFNEDDICEIVYWNKALKRNCPGFADENDITFLDGNQ